MYALHPVYPAEPGKSEKARRHDDQNSEEPWPDSTSINSSRGAVTTPLPCSFAEHCADPCIG